MKMRVANLERKLILKQNGLVTIVVMILILIIIIIIIIMTIFIALIQVCSKRMYNK